MTKFQVDNSNNLRFNIAWLRDSRKMYSENVIKASLTIVMLLCLNIYYIYMS